MKIYHSTHGETGVRDITHRIYINWSNFNIRLGMTSQNIMYANLSVFPSLCHSIQWHRNSTFELFQKHSLNFIYLCATFETITVRHIHTQHTQKLMQCVVFMYCMSPKSVSVVQFRILFTPPKTVKHILQ